MLFSTKSNISEMLHQDQKYVSHMNVYANFETGGNHS